MLKLIRSLCVFSIPEPSVCWAGLLGAIVLTASSFGGAAQAQSDPRGWPLGLSAEARRTIQAFEARIIEAGRETEIEPRKMPTEFMGKVAVRIAQETLGGNWSAVREYADRALAALPVVDAGGLEAREAAAVFPPPEAQDEYDRAMTLIGSREASLAALRAWDPSVAMRGAASQVLGFALTAEDFGRHSILSGLVSQSLARTTWKGEDALIGAQGAWIIVFTYLRTPNGLFVAKRTRLFPRQGSGADPFQ